MEDLYNKYKEVLQENNELKHKIIDLTTKLDLYETSTNTNSTTNNNEENTFLIEKQKELIKENIELRKMIYNKENENTEEMKQMSFVNNLILENKKIKEENQNLIYLKNTNKSNNEELSSELMDYKNYNKKFVKIVTALLGYKIEIIGNTITLHSIYAFDKEDVFIFNQENDKIMLQSNDFAISWSKEIDSYLINGRSVPAFLSSVTLELFSKKTYG